nr:L-glutamine-D-fructose-6-phosphate [Sciadococcus taiwanensis]
MCGIIGYIGETPYAKDILIKSLNKLEYRGYDSAGIALVINSELILVRSQGKLKQLINKINSFKTLTQESYIGIGHTRWATHGKPSEKNAHPHGDYNNNIAVVHNGIIENYEIIKAKLIDKNINFLSDTDTEVIPNLIAYKRIQSNLDIISAIESALAELEGNFAVALVTLDFPKALFVYKNNAPLVIGIGEKQYFCASDPIALLNYTQKFINLENRELSCLTAHNISIYKNGKLLPSRKAYFLNWSPLEVEKQGFTTFMLKEIYEQPNVIKNCLNKYLRFPIKKDSNTNSPIYFRNITSLYKNIKYIQILACGSSWHAALIGKYILEHLTHIPTNVYYASEFKITPPPISPCTLTIAVSQSGETADILSALKIERERRIIQSWLYQPRLLAITNRPESSISNHVSYIIDTKAGIEIGVAATKSFMAQIIIILLLALDISFYKSVLNNFQVLQILEELKEIPTKIEQIFKTELDNIKTVSQKFAHTKDFIYIAKGINFPIALEGALKLKEISYIHAEGYPSGEMKHGHIALLDKNVPVVAILLPANVFEKVLSNAQEAKARESPLLVITSICNTYIKHTFEHIFQIPLTNELLYPILSIIPLQLLAYYIAINKGLDVDQPRNLAKSVTVE